MIYFDKPKDLKYTDMCIFIDNYIASHEYNDTNDEITYKYLYLVAKMLAFKRAFFKKNDDYEQFSLYAASQYYVRLKKENAKAIKSCLNYMKKTLYFYKVLFEEEFMNGLAQYVTESPMEYQTSFDYVITTSMDEIESVEFDNCLSNICDMIKSFLSHIPYVSKPDVWTNIYISCLLTYLNSITVDRRDAVRINNYESYSYKMDCIENTISNHSVDDVILFRLDEGMRNYIYVLYKEINKMISNDLSFRTHYTLPSGKEFQALILANVLDSESCQE